VNWQSEPVTHTHHGVAETGSRCESGAVAPL
jgi:hypothetical protein